MHIAPACSGSAPANFPGCIVAGPCIPKPRGGRNKEQRLCACFLRRFTGAFLYVPISLVLSRRRPVALVAGPHHRPVGPNLTLTPALTTLIRVLLSTGRVVTTPTGVTKLHVAQTNEFVSLRNW